MVTREAFLTCLLMISAPITVFGQTVQQKQSVSDFYAALDNGDKQALYKIMLADPALRNRGVEKKPTAQAAMPAKAPTTGPDQGQTTPVPTEAAKCANQSFFLRRDRTDVFGFLVPCGPSDVPGASASYTNDMLAHTQNLNIQALAGYTMTRGSNSEGTFLYSITPSVYLGGVRAEPFKATERNAVRAAIDSEFLASTPDFIFRTQTVDIAPYYQTDFRGMARIEGIDALWEPYNLDILLGGRYDEQARRPVGFYWRLQGEADVNRVETAGRTNFTSGTNHAFLGGTLQARAIFFQNMPEVGEALCGRVYANGTAQRFTDAEAGRSISNYTAEVGYYLSSGVAPYWRFCVPKAKGEAPLPSASATSSSISLVYSYGTDKTTLVDQRQYKAQLNFRY
jgi:hypothetical protein